MISDVMLFTLEYLFANDSKQVLFSSKSNGLPRLGPKPPVHPWGPGYDIHPELTRSGGSVLLSQSIVPAAYVGLPVGLALANFARIEGDESVATKPGAYQMFSSALSGSSWNVQINI